MDKFSTYFGLKLAHLVFGATEQVSITLQHKEINAQEAITAVKSVQLFLEQHRTVSAFNLFFDRVVEKAKQEGLQEPSLPRQRKIPRRFDDGSPNHIYSSTTEYFRCQYFEVLDVLREQLVSRFDQPTLSILKDIESLLVSSCNGSDTTNTPSTKLKTLYASKLNMDLLTVQLSMLPSVIAAGNSEHQLGIKEVTSVSTICDVFNTCRFPKTMLTEVNKLLHIYYTVPLTSATAERTFSTLRRLKTYLRSTMTQKRLNHIVLLHIHKSMTDSIDLQSIAVEFVKRNDRRLRYFGHY